MTTESTSDNPATSDVPTTGDTLTSVVQGYKDRHPAPSEGDTPSTPEPPADVTGQPEPEPQPDESGKVTRLEQDLAKQKKFLSNLGIDADSDFIERYNAGLISPDQLLKQAGVTPSATEAPPNAMQRLLQHTEKVKKQVDTGKGVTEKDYLEGMAIVAEVANEGVRLRQQTETDALYSQCQTATLSALDKDELHNAAPDDIKTIESQMFWVSTDNLLATDAHSLGNPESYFTPKSYTLYATKNMERLQALRNHWIEHGKKLARNQIAPTPSVNPIPATTGSGPATPPLPRIDRDNMGEAARNYAQQRAVV